MKIIPRISTPQFILAIAFSTAFILIPWNEIFFSANGYGFRDREVYTNYFLYQTNVINYASFDTFTTYITREFAWHYGISSLVAAGATLDLIFLSISFSTILIFSLIATKSCGLRGQILLLNPLVVDFAFSQLRLALAMSLLGAAYLSLGRRKYVSIAISAIAPFIHTGSLIFIAIYALSHLLHTYSTRRLRLPAAELVLLLSLGALISIAIGPFREIILFWLGDRRAVYHDMSSSISYSLFWIFLLGLLSIDFRESLRHDWSRYSIVILSIVATNLIHGGYSTRFIAASFPFLIASTLNLNGKLRLFSLVCFSFYAILQWLYWLRLLGG